MYEIIETINVDRDKVGIEATRGATNFTEIKRCYDWGIEQRKKEQSPCDKGLTDLNPVRECYFSPKKIII